MNWLLVFLFFILTIVQVTFAQMPFALALILAILFRGDYRLAFALAAFFSLLISSLSNIPLFKVFLATVLTLTMFVFLKKQVPSSAFLQLIVLIIFLLVWEISLFSLLKIAL